MRLWPGGGTDALLLFRGTGTPGLTATPFSSCLLFPAVLDAILEARGGHSLAGEMASGGRRGSQAPVSGARPKLVAAEFVRSQRNSALSDDQDGIVSDLGVVLVGSRLERLPASFSAALHTRPDLQGTGVRWMAARQSREREMKRRTEGLCRLEDADDHEFDEEEGINDMGRQEKNLNPTFPKSLAPLRPISHDAIATPTATGCGALLVTRGHDVVVLGYQEPLSLADPAESLGASGGFSLPLYLTTG